MWVSLSPGRRRPEEIQVITLSASPTPQKPPRWENDRSKRPGIIDRCCHSVKKTDTKYHVRYIRRQAAFDIATHSTSFRANPLRTLVLAFVRRQFFAPLASSPASLPRNKRLRDYVRSGTKDCPFLSPTKSQASHGRAAVDSVPSNSRQVLNNRSQLPQSQQNHRH